MEGQSEGQSRSTLVSQALLDVALGLPAGWKVVIEPSGQLCLEPPSEVRSTVEQWIAADREQALKRLAARAD